MEKLTSGAVILFKTVNGKSTYCGKIGAMSNTYAIDTPTRIDGHNLFCAIHLRKKKRFSKSIAIFAVVKIEDFF